MIMTRRLCLFVIKKRLPADALPVLLLLCVLLAGCTDRYGQQPYYTQQPPPPPPAWARNSPLVQRAYSNGFRDGRADGERDQLARYGYHPRQDDKFRIAPGYVERQGPFDLYRDSYQDAYVRGYDNGFRHAEQKR